MKALELLKSFHTSIGVYKFPSSCEVSEAIKELEELEELVKLKPCEGCKRMEDVFTFYGCIRHETKEQ